VQIPGFSHLRKNLGFDVLIQLCLAGLFFFIYAYVFSWIIPEGINRFFLTETIVYYWPVLWFMALFILACLFLRKLDLKKTGRRLPGISKGDLFLLVLPLGPIIQYVILNPDILSFSSASMVVIIFSGCAFLLSFMIPLLLPSFEYQNILMILGISFSFVLFNMASLASGFHWHRTGDLQVQISVFLFVFLALFMLHRYCKKLLLVMVLAFAISGIASSVMSIFLKAEDTGLEIVAISRISTVTGNRSMARTPDIFLLTYDSYVENETMLQYGIDNSAQEEYLSSRGFHLYKGVYSVSADSLGSMDRMLDVNLEVKPSRRAVSGNGNVHVILEKRGYATFGILNNDYLFIGTKPAYDRFYPEPQETPVALFAKAVLEGEFRFDTGFDGVMFSDFVEQKRKIMGDRNDSPKFLYTHTGPGHSQNSGKCLPNEVELFEERLVEANQEMKEDIQTVIENNPDAIIIVNGDHGPYLTKNCTSLTEYEKEEIRRLDIQDRFGTFLAIRWPEGAEIEHGKIRILQDVFPVVFSYLFDDRSIQDATIPDITLKTGVTAGVTVENGIIRGGMDDGEPLFPDLEH